MRDAEICATRAAKVRWMQSASIWLNAIVAGKRFSNAPQARAVSYPSLAWLVTAGAAAAVISSSPFTKCASAAQSPITLQSLLHEMVDRDAQARWPSPEYRCKEFTSYDRRSVSPDKPGWFANVDQGNYLRVEENQGRKEWAMMDADGPGAIVCFFKATTDPTANVRIYLDRNATPVINENLRYFLGGGAETEQEKHFREPRVPPFPADGEHFLGGFGTIKPPLAGVQSLGCDLYLPIPYARHCKVTYDKPGRCYYRINYRTYPPSTSVETFSLAGLKEAAPVIDQISHTLLNPADTAAGLDPTGAVSNSLKPGASMVATLAGPAAIRSLSIRLHAGNMPQALRSTVLSITFDGEQTVWCPAGDFFSTGIGIHPYHDWAFSVENDGTMHCLWVMPFKKKCTIQLTNLGTEPIDATLGYIGRSSWTWDDRSMYFHGSWRQQYSIATRASDGTRDWNYIQAAGRGVCVGDTLVMHNSASAWWGEGDEKIYVDGDSRGGRESIFFESPFAAHTQVEGDYQTGYSTLARLRSLDAIPFSTGLKFDMEIWHWKATTVAYAATTYWYGRPGASSNRMPDETEAARPILEDATLAKQSGN
jgi:hypothetical protein